MLYQTKDTQTLLSSNVFYKINSGQEVIDYWTGQVLSYSDLFNLKSSFVLLPNDVNIELGKFITGEYWVYNYHTNEYYKSPNIVTVNLLSSEL